MARDILAYFMWVKKGAIGAIGSVAHNMYVAIVAGGGFDDLRFLIALQQASEGFVSVAWCRKGSPPHNL